MENENRKISQSVESGLINQIGIDRVYALDQIAVSYVYITGSCRNRIESTRFARLWDRIELVYSGIGGEQSNVDRVNDVIP